MYTIKEAAKRGGISPALLRQWERRYGVVHPARTGSGYRSYDDAAIARIRAMRRLVDEGWAPNAAAQAVRDRDDAAIAAIVGRDPEPSGTASPAGLTAGRDLIDTFLSAAASLDAGGVEGALDEMFALGSFEETADRYVLPSLRRIGDAWEAGVVDVAAEHAASHAVHRRLAAAYQAAGHRPRAAGAVLVGLPPGARHELGALAFSVAARRAGLPVLYLGADLPVTDWVAAAGQTEARAAVVGAVVDRDVAPTLDVAGALLATRPDIVVAIGGPAAASVPAQPGVIRLPERLGASVRRLEEALSRTGTG